MASEKKPSKSFVDVSNEEYKNALDGKKRKPVSGVAQSLTHDEKLAQERLEELIKDVGNADPYSIHYNGMAGGFSNVNNSTVSVGQAPWANMPTVETKKWRTVTIDAAENGFVVIIGCKTFVETSWEKVSEKLLEYWIDPVAAEKKYCK